MEMVQLEMFWSHWCERINGLVSYPVSYPCGHCMELSPEI